MLTNPYFPFQAQLLQGEGVNAGQDGGNLLPLSSLLQSIARTNNEANTIVGSDVFLRPSLVVSPQPIPSQPVAASVGTGTQNDCNSNYRDYSRVPVDESEAFFASAQLDDGGEPRGTNFPSKLHDMLSREEIFDVISWCPHGRSWRVLKPKAFELKILPKYFRHGNYNSFMRQVNGWGFRRISQGPDFNSYYHEYFLRGMPHLCRRMRRASVSKGDGEVAYDPDFRTMRPVPMQAESSSSSRTRTAEKNRSSDSDSSVQSSSHLTRQIPVQQQTNHSHARQEFQNGNGNVAQNAVLRAMANMQASASQPTVTHAQSSIFCAHNSPQQGLPDIAGLLRVLQQQQQVQQALPFPVRQQQGQAVSRFPVLQRQPPVNVNNFNMGQGQNATSPQNQQQLLLEAIFCLSQQVQRNQGNHQN
jgi:hypothetical protein